MTNKEAIEVFSKVRGLPCGWCYEGGDEFKEALDRAIKALENARKLHKWLDPDIDPELALEKIRELVYFGEEADNETDN